MSTNGTTTTHDIPGFTVVAPDMEHPDRRVNKLMNTADVRVIVDVDQVTGIGESRVTALLQALVGYSRMILVSSRSPAKVVSITPVQTCYLRSLSMRQRLRTT